MGSWAATWALLTVVNAQEQGCGLMLDTNCVRAPKNATSFIVTVADDMGYGDAGYLGGRFPTPSLDALAKRAVRLNKFYAAAPVCSPTRASLLTGRHASRCGIHDANQGHLPQNEYTLQRALGALGVSLRSSSLLIP